MGEARGSLNGGAEVGTAPPGPASEPPTSPRATLGAPKVSLHLDDGTREKVRKRLYDALLRARAKPDAADGPDIPICDNLMWAAALHMESECYQSSTSRSAVSKLFIFVLWHSRLAYVNPWEDKFHKKPLSLGPSTANRLTWTRLPGHFGAELLANSIKDVGTHSVNTR